MAGGAARRERRLQKSNKLVVGSGVRECCRGGMGAWMQGDVSMVNIHDRKQSDRTLVGDCCHLNDPVPEGTKFVLQPRKSSSDVKFRNQFKDLPFGC